jgi:hypothetical protein
MRLGNGWRRAARRGGCIYRGRQIMVIGGRGLTRMEFEQSERHLRPCK